MTLFRDRSGPRIRHIPDESAPYETISVDKLTPIIGGEIGGVDLSRPLGNGSARILSVMQRLDENCQSISPFGRIEIRSGRAVAETSRRRP
jgi:taurine dioxygenase